MMVTSSPSRRMAASPKRIGLAVLGHLAALAVERLVLDEDHRVVVADGGLQQPLASAGVLGTATSRPGTCR